MIPYGKHYIDKDDIAAVTKVLKSDALTQGPMVAEFEANFAKYVGANYAVAVSSCTAGLHIASKILGVNKTNKIITSPVTFVSSPNSSLYLDSRPIFCDIDPETLNLNPDLLENIILNNPNAKVLMPVHFAGHSCDMEKIYSICNKYKIKIIEDAAHGLGAKHSNGTMVGSCSYSDMAVFSLHPVKSIAAGEGGVVTTNSFDYYKELVRLRSHGINKIDDDLLNEHSFENGTKKAWIYEMQTLGFNYRITDIQCALANSQLKKLDEFIIKRKKIAKKYDQELIYSKNYYPAQKFNLNNSYHLYVLRVKYSSIGKTRSQLMNSLKKKKIITQVHYIPVYNHPFYQNLGYSSIGYDHSNKYYEEALSIPIYYSLTDEEQDYVIACLKELID